MTVPAAAQTPQQMLETIGYARSLFDPQGGAGAATGQQPDLASTIAVLRTCRYLGWTLQDYERKPTIDFVKGCFDPGSGGFGLTPGGNPDVRATALGLIVLGDLKQPLAPYGQAAFAYLAKEGRGFEDVRIAAAAWETAAGTPQRQQWLDEAVRTRWIALIQKTANADGAFGQGANQARDTGGAVAALLRLGVKLDSSSGVTRAILAGQRADGGFGRDDAGSDLETTYRVMRALYMLGAKPEIAKLRGFIASCRNAGGGYGVRPGEPSGAGPTYFASIVLHWLRELEAGLGQPPQTRRIVPASYDNVFSPYREPVGWLNPGDTLVTRTLDAGGWDESGVRRAGRGNPLTGPFFIRSAEPGDTLVVELKRIDLTKDTGYQSDTIAATAVTPQYFAKQKDGYGLVTWRLDRRNMLGTPDLPGLERLRVPLRPFLGCLGVAPRWEALSSATAGTHGGNMDYNRLVAGVTVQLPVSLPGALLYCGDGHAAQGDGEIPGSAIETSMEVELTVRVVKDQQPPGVRAEDAQQLIAVGVERNLDEALQLATANMAEWLQARYGLSHEAVALLMGTVAEYDVGNIVDPRYTVACRVAKRYLEQVGEHRTAHALGDSRQ